MSIHYNGDERAISNCLVLAKRVRDAMVVERERGLNPDQLVNIQTTLRKKHKDIVAVHCKDRGISQEEYLRGLIIRDLLQRHGVDVIGESKAIRALKRNQPGIDH